jgi:F-type H+-transporting ATPase subunit a
VLGKNLLLSQFVHNPEINQISVLGKPLGDVHVDTLALSAACMLGILAYSAWLAPRLVLDGPGGVNQAISESLYGFLDDLAHGQIGALYKKFFPLVAAIFIFVLIGNFIGIGPWRALEHLPGWFKLPNGESFEIASPTTDFNVTAGLAAISVLVYLGAGVAKHGGKYIKTILFNPVEWLDLLVRPSTLALRLMLVITADEITRLVFLLMLPWLAPTFVMAFEIFIALIQAFVFALLTSIYIGLAVSEHH